MTPKPSRNPRKKDQTNSPDLVEITHALRTLFLFRTLISLALIMAGIGCIYCGHLMLMNLATAQANVLFAFGTTKITASGIGAVVMCSSLFAFWLAYLSAPSVNFVPTNVRLRSGGGFSSGGRYLFSFFQKLEGIPWLPNMLKNFFRSVLRRFSA